ncbi:MFS transporter [Sulfitobacter sp. M57]|uniref:MFS transporter n=1 Tax=unclassified Sulfitobacter TaxID=196795 RepID=UPI0023E1524B|nr:MULTISPECIES: MFS transporter [unclassified Sulfitobacter]MDF3414729.1 MFS transporter [Sulfitobacter sp. KE5]MDF3422210.1 MFS transporter [Sulfitobacter sp. KE43]MDF3433275.1 MFS transporter [Sulfitobacter sp. KE42]MDF3458915.1 MFS transporter [Sulfitobacter sp. S74]MDF3462814.1 MFS transporter [Sulfitobacter sp. Ks18]
MAPTEDATTQGHAATGDEHGALKRNLTLYPWFKFAQNLTFWQAIWFLLFQNTLSAAQAILLYAIYDVATTVMEVPSGYMSDRLGRRRTLIAAAFFGALGAALVAVGSGFAVFALAQVCLGVSAAFSSGTDSALLYESLKVQGRAAEVEAQETRGWQAALIGLALSAITGGVLASYHLGWAFVAGAVAQVLALIIAWRFVEPLHERGSVGSAGLSGQWRHFRQAMGRPVLVWLFILSVLMYGFSHVPFIFGQPFIAQALEGLTWSPPIVSGTVSAMMMLVSVLASLVALKLRRRIGLSAILLLAFGIQIGLIGVLSLTDSALAIAVLLLRMVPNSFARPFIVARMQPLLDDAGRATYLSLQSFVGRLLLAGSLLFASARVQQDTVMVYADIQVTLGGYAIAGLVFLLALSALARWAKLEGGSKG